MTTLFWPPTEKQLDYVRALQAKLRIPNGILDQHCRDRFGQNLVFCSRHEVSQLLDEMSEWEALPANLQRAMGQLDLFGDAK